MDTLISHPDTYVEILLVHVQGCCSDLEAKGAGGWKDELNPEETMGQICRDTSRVEYRIGQSYVTLGNCLG